FSMGEDIQLFNERKLKIRRRLEIIIEELDKTTDKERQSALRALEDDVTNQILTITFNIQKLTENLTKNFNTVEDLKKRVASESGKTKEEIRGGGKLGNREE